MAKKIIFKHTESWIEKLTVPKEELQPSERSAISKHLAACPKCHRIVAENYQLDRLIQASPTPDFPPGLPPKLLQVWEEEDRNVKREAAPEAGTVYTSGMKDGEIWRQRVNPRTTAYPAPEESSRKVERDISRRS
jgi:Zn-finger nucleic acid-binding protein